MSQPRPAPIAADVHSTPTLPDVDSSPPERRRNHGPVGATDDRADDHAVLDAVVRRRRRLHTSGRRPHHVRDGDANLLAKIGAPV